MKVPILMNISTSGTSDPYVSVAVVDPATLKEIKLKCDPIKKTLNPIWNFNLHSYAVNSPGKREAIQKNPKTDEPF